MLCLSVFECLFKQPIVTKKFVEHIHVRGISAMHT